MKKTELSREISKSNLLFISFTAIFGSGWLFAPHYAAQIAGPAALISWCFGGLMSAVIGIAMAEVVTLFPRSGGLAGISTLTHGKLLGFLINILTLVVCILLPVLEVRAILQYMSSYFKFLSGDMNGFSAMGYVVACGLLLLVSWINLLGSKVMSQVSQSSVILKLVAPLIICGSFLYSLKYSGRLNHQNLVPFLPTHWSDVFIAMSTSGIIFSFNGFNQATLFAGEAKDPQKSIPFAIVGSLVLTSILYLLIQYVFLISIPSPSLGQGWKGLTFSGDSGPFAGIAAILGLNWLLILIYADAVVSPLGTAFTYASAAPRMFYSLAENTESFPILKKLNKNGAPIFSVGLSFLIGFCLFLVLPSLKAMISILVAGFVLCYTAAPASLLSLRSSHGHLERKFQVPFAKAFCFLALVFSNFMVFCCGWIPLRNLLIILSVATLFGICINFLENRSMKTTIRNLSGCAWFLIQLALLSGVSFYYENKTLSFSTSSLWIGLVSLVSLIFSQYSQRENFNELDFSNG